MMRKSRRAEEAPVEMHGSGGELLPTIDCDTIGVQHDGGHFVKGGFRGDPGRSEARSMEEKVESGESAEFDRDRAERSGRHYGRRGAEEPGPRYGRGPSFANSSKAR